MSTVNWAFTADYLETCNCKHVCPCLAIGIPSDGTCEALVGWQIQTGHYGDTKLDGLVFVAAWLWPKAIHDGNGTAAYFVTKDATPEQRKAITEIVSGRAGGKQPFTIFADTFTTVHEPQFVDIEFVSEGRNGSFKVPGVLDVELQGFIQPWDGEIATRDVKISFNETGLLYDWVIVAMSRVMRIFGGGLNFDHAGRNAFFSVVEYGNE